MIANLGDKVKQNKQKKVKLRAKVEEDPFDVQAVNPDPALAHSRAA